MSYNDDMICEINLDVMPLPSVACNKTIRPSVWDSSIIAANNSLLTFEHSVAYLAQFDNNEPSQVRVFLLPTIIPYEQFVLLYKVGCQQAMPWVVCEQ